MYLKANCFVPNLRTNRAMKKTFVVVAATLLLLFGGLYTFQDTLIFRADKLDTSYVFNFNQPFEEYFITTPDSQSINVLWFKPEGKASGLILYFHGNANNLQRWGHYAEDMTRLGFEVVMMDYRGYGKSTGEPSEQFLYDDAALLYQWVMSRTTPSRLIIYGRSLGTPVATKLASSVQPEMLILETPFDELRGASPAYLRSVLSFFPMRYSFPTKDFLVHVKGKKLIFHGTEDRVVPLSSALRLRPLLREGDEFIIINNGNHRNLKNFREYQLKLVEVLKK